MCCLLYQSNLEYKKKVILPEQTISTGCNSVRKSLQTLENMKEGHSRDTLSSDKCLKTSPTCNTLKRKLYKNDTSEVTDLPSKLPKTGMNFYNCLSLLDLIINLNKR